MMTLPGDLPRRAWTGGKMPPRGFRLPAFRRTAAVFFGEQVADWRAAWGDTPPRDVLRTFVRRALADAFATLDLN